jgi:acetylornithine deacetylase
MPSSVEKKRLREILAGFVPRVRELLADMIAFPSTHGNESEVQAYLEGKWEDAGFTVERRPIPEDIKADPEYSCPAEDRDFRGRDNLVVRVESSGPGRSVIINSHVDIVPASEWPGAFQSRIEEDLIYGRGACDAKGSVATMYLTACALRELGVQPGGEVMYQMVIDEEVGGNGSLALIREGIQADGVVVLEPTELAFHPANRGAIWFRFDFQGKPCHMGRKHTGINAIDLAYEAIGILYEYEKELIGDKESQPLFAHYEVPTQVNVGTLHAGEYPSIVAGSAVMEGGIGFLPIRSMAQVKKDLVRRIEQRGSEALKSRYRLAFPKLHNDSYETPIDHPLVKTFHTATKETDAREDITGWNVSCDARLFAKIGGMPTVVFGPGNIQSAHSAEERVSLSEIVTAAETLIRFIEKWCSPAP